MKTLTVLLPVLLSYLCLLIVRNDCATPSERLCGDSECSVPISRAKTILRYISSEEEKISFERGIEVEVFSKSLNVWDIKVGNKIGKAPSTFLREFKVLIPTKNLITVPDKTPSNPVEVETTQNDSVDVVLEKTKEIPAGSRSLLSFPSMASAETVQAHQGAIPTPSSPQYEVLDGTTLWLDPLPSDQSGQPAPPLRKASGADKSVAEPEGGSSESPLDASLNSSEVQEIPVADLLTSAGAEESSVTPPSMGDDKLYDPDPAFESSTETTAAPTVIAPESQAVTSQSSSEVEGTKLSDDTSSESASKVDSESVIVSTSPPSVSLSDASVDVALDPNADSTTVESDREATTEASETESIDQEADSQDIEPTKAGIMTNIWNTMFSSGDGTEENSQENEEEDGADEEDDGEGENEEDEDSSVEASKEQPSATESQENAPSQGSSIDALKGQEPSGLEVDLNEGGNASILEAGGVPQTLPQPSVDLASSFSQVNIGPLDEIARSPRQADGPGEEEVSVEIEDQGGDQIMSQVSGEEQPKASQDAKPSPPEEEGNVGQPENQQQLEQLNVEQDEKQKHLEDEEQKRQEAEEQRRQQEEEQKRLEEEEQKRQQEEEQKRKEEEEQRHQQEEEKKRKEEEEQRRQLEDELKLQQEEEERRQVEEKQRQQEEEEKKHQEEEEQRRQQAEEEKRKLESEQRRLQEEAEKVQKEEENQRLLAAEQELRRQNEEEQRLHDELMKRQAEEAKMKEKEPISPAQALQEELAKAREARMKESEQISALEVPQEEAEMGGEIIPEVQTPVEEQNAETQEGLFAWVSNLFGSASQPESNDNESAVIIEEPIKSEPPENALPPEYYHEHPNIWSAAEQTTCSSSSPEADCEMKGEEDAEETGNIFMRIQAPSLDVILLRLAATSIALFLGAFSFYFLRKKHVDSSLVAHINELEKQLLVASKEAVILSEKASSLDATIDSEEVNQLQEELELCRLARADLEEQVATLERELEEATETGIELNRLLSETLEASKGKAHAGFAASVERLQQQLDGQKEKVDSLTRSLKSTCAENENLKSAVGESRERISALEAELAAAADIATTLRREREEANVSAAQQLQQVQSRLEDALSSKVLEESRLGSEVSSLKLKVETLRASLSMKDAEVKALQDTLKESEADDGKADQLFDVVKLKAELEHLKKERNEYIEKYHEEEKARKGLEERLDKVAETLQELQGKVDSSEKLKEEAETRLTVLSNYFKEKEEQLLKELGLKEAIVAQHRGDESSVIKHLQLLQEEVDTYRAQNESLKNEIIDQERDFKGQIASLEKKAHDNWMAARQAERRLEDSRQESAQLRNRLTLVEKHNSDPSSRLDANGEGTVASPVMMMPLPPLGDMETPPPLPPFMFSPPPYPPPFMPPPLPPHPMGRPPPLGRMSSPPPPPLGQFSPPPMPFDRLERSSRSPSPPPHRYHHRSPPPPHQWDELRPSFRSVPKPSPKKPSEHRDHKGSLHSSGHSNDSMDKSREHV